MMPIGIYIRTEEHKRKTGLAHKGKPLSKKHKRKISIALKGRKQPPRSEEQRKNMSKIMKGKHFSPATEFKKGHKLSKKSEKKRILALSGEKNYNWKNGRAISRGYVFILMPNHSSSNKAGYVQESRLVMEKQIGRHPNPKEIVHHINEIKNDNRIKNLMLFKNTGYHRAFHYYGYCNPKGIIFDGRKLK